MYKEKRHTVIYAPAPTIDVPILVAKAKASNKESASAPLHLLIIVVEIISTRMDDQGQGRSCKEHINCGEVIAEDVVVRLWKVQIMVEGREERAIDCVWVTDGIDCCRINFLPCHMAKHITCYDGALGQVNHVFSAVAACQDSAERRTFHKNKGHCLTTIISCLK